MTIEAVVMRSPTNTRGTTLVATVASSDIPFDDHFLSAFVGACLSIFHSWFKLLYLCRERPDQIRL